MPIQIGLRSPRRFVVPRSHLASVVRLIAEFEVSDAETASWTVPVQDLLASHGQAGASLRGARAKEGITQTALAAKLGIPQPNVSQMESGERPIGKKMARRLAKILKIDYRVFL